MPRPLRLTLLAALLCGLLSGFPGAMVAPAQAQSGYGWTDGRNGPLRAGCHGYRYHWVLKPRTNDWLFETFLIDPSGRKLASGMLDSDSEQKRDHSRFRFCRYSTRPGRFTIRARLTWYDGYTDHHVWLNASHFRLHR